MIKIFPIMFQMFGIEVT